MSEPTIQDAQAILEQFHASDWDELRIQAADFELHVFKTPRERRPAASATPSPAVPPPQPATTSSAKDSPLSPEAAPPPTTDPTARGGDLVVVRAPNLGTFYRAPKPGAEPFVSIGQQVEPSSEICIIEVMKLFTSVQAGVSGIVREVLVADGDLVEYDQPLVVIDTAGS